MVSIYKEYRICGSVNSADCAIFSCLESQGERFLFWSLCRILESSTVLSVESPNPRPSPTNAFSFSRTYCTTFLKSRHFCQWELKSWTELLLSWRVRNQQNHFHYLHPDAQTMMSDPVLLPTFTVWSHGPELSGIIFFLLWCLGTQVNLSLELTITFSFGSCEGC